MKGHLIFKFSYKFCKIDPQEDSISIVGLQKSLLHFINSKVTVKCGFTIFLAKHFFLFLHRKFKSHFEILHPKRAVISQLGHWSQPNKLLKYQHL